MVQVRGAGAPDLVAPLLQSSRPLNLNALPEDELRLCRLVDDGQVIDDVLVSVTRGPGTSIIDLNLHGGPRVVQRALLALQRAGAEIVPAAALGPAWPTRSKLERELLALLPSAGTRAVARWLLRLESRLQARLTEIRQALSAGEIAQAREQVQRLLEAHRPIRRVLSGVRVVLFGEPNVGKSTLANALAGSEEAIVSDVPGTTRDYTEHPGAVGGVPFTFVDTAGVRETADPLEQEAIRRTHAQLSRADIVLHIRDGSRPPVSGEPVPPGASLTVLTKADLGIHAGWGSEGLPVSARSGLGMESLRKRLLQMVELEEWEERLVGPVTDRQAAGLASAAEGLRTMPADVEHVARLLSELAA